jgi:hypothetical protein
MTGEPVIVTVARPTAYEIGLLVLRLIGRALREALRIVAIPVSTAQRCASRWPVLVVRILRRRIVVAEWV